MLKVAASALLALALVGPAELERARYVGPAEFERARYVEPAEFERARYVGPAEFERAKYVGPAEFERASTRLAQVTNEFTCAAQLGTGLKSKRTFCDIIVGTTVTEGVRMAIPAHNGATTLRFDLHNRYTMAPPGATPAQMYAKHTAVVAVLNQAGQTVGKAAVSRELRTEVDIFDRVEGGIGPDGTIMVAPGRPEAVVLELPESVTSIAIVGVSLEATSIAMQGTFVTPGRPVAVGSNFRIEYTRK